MDDAILVSQLLGSINLWIAILTLIKQVERWIFIIHQILLWVVRSRQVVVLNSVALFRIGSCHHRKIRVGIILLLSLLIVFVFVIVFVLLATPLAHWRGVGGKA